MSYTILPPSRPLGLMPRWLWREKRIWEIISAIERYHQAKEPVPTEWFTELHEHLTEHATRNTQHAP